MMESRLRPGDLDRRPIQRASLRRWLENSVIPHVRNHRDAETNHETREMIQDFLDAARDLAQHIDLVELGR